MQRLFRLTVLLAILMVLSVMSVSAQGPVISSGNETSELWFVELNSAPAADGTNINTVRQEKQTFRNNARNAGLNFKERFAFDTLWNGVSVQIDRSQIGTLARLDGVKAIYPVYTFSLPPESPINPDLAYALAMTGADIAQSELGYTGKGIKVAVMDTGIDYDHPDLGGDGVQRSNSNVFPTARVIKGWDFVGDAYNADPSSAAYNPTPAPDAYPDDCNGHGTHVSGIIGAKGAVKGVAPEVHFGAYRVFGCSGSTTADIMMAAMERALADGMQVLNMSIGSAYQWPQYPTAQASDRLVNKGMVVVASIGNNGANGLYSAGAPGVGKKVIGVASFDNTHVSLAAFTISPDNTQIGYGNAAAAPPAPLSGSYPITKVNTVGIVPPGVLPTNDGCNPLPAGSLTGQVALIRRGTCPFYQKAFNAQQAGAVAVVLYNNVAGRFSPTVAGSPAITIPVVAISDTEGVLIHNRLVAGPVTMTWTNQFFTSVNPTGGQISSFSSFGLAPDLSLKPDIGAPGGLIRSTYPIEGGSYATISGTSMSSPHVAGAVALLLQAKPKTPSQIVGTILQNSAEPKPRVGTPAGLDNAHRQGAGMLRIDRAILATTKIEPGELALGESQAGPKTYTLSIENNGNTAVTYNLSHEGALATGPNTFVPTYHAEYATVVFSAPSVTIPAGGKASVNVTITAPAGLADRSLYGGYLVFTPQSGGQVYRVPYAGFKGDYQSIPVLTGGFPYLGRLTACNPPAILRGSECFGGGTFGVHTTPGAVFTLVPGIGQTPFILVHLDHQVRKLRVEVFEANTNKAWHRAFDLDYVGRNSSATSFFAFPWDGTTKGGNKTYVVPDGQYYFKLSIQKALGDDNNPAHWETWTSPMFVIDRP
jgi:subtilisin family serine protease